MSEITRVGADLAKRVIQVHGVDAGGKLVTNRALPRDKFIAWCAQLSASVSAGGSVQHGLSAAGGVHGFYQHCSAADKR